MNIGTLNPLPAAEHTELVSPSVAQAMRTLPTDQIWVAEIDPNLSDTAQFCEHYQVGMDQAANCVILEAKRGENTWLAACVVLGSTRADVNGLARKTLDARRVSFAPMDQAVSQTGMEYGAITPIGLPNNWPILIDQTVVNAELVIIGSGLRKSKLIVPGKLLATLPNVQALPGLAQSR
jgi:prolyl-tRNA editing enzyme YbaK/EbsC (Cys-tRNA(Pro) deacylase)